MKFGLFEVLSMNSLKTFRKQQVHCFFLKEVASFLIAGFSGSLLKVFLLGYKEVVLTIKL
jgi:hypothetical protein